MNDADSLRAHAERIRASRVLGRSRLVQRLFDFLLECSLTGKAPKEIEVAIDVFGKDAGFDVSQDAVVRVYVHKLRRKLEEHYAKAGANEPVHLTIPKGAYRFTLEQAEAAAAPPVAESVVAARAGRDNWRPWLVGALLASLVVNVFLVGRPHIPFTQGDTSVRELQAHRLWSPLLEDDRPIFIVLGDYYIFGETDGSPEVKRLVREFSINSSSDLERYFQLNPGSADRYLDLQLDYLPTASAFALRDIMPVLGPANRRVRVTLMSDLNPEVFKSAHVIYIGYLSGMGMLQNLVFAGSRFSVGDTYDELIDRRTQKRYVSQAGVPPRDETKYHDYGYFATFPGPTGNRIMIVAGTRDVAVMNTAEALTSTTALRTLVEKAGDTQGFEALYEVYGMDRMNLDGKLLLTSRLDTRGIWSSEQYGLEDDEREAAVQAARLHN